MTPTERSILFGAIVFALFLFTFALACGPMATANAFDDASQGDDTGYGGYFLTEADASLGIAPPPPNIADALPADLVDVTPDLEAAPPSVDAASPSPADACTEPLLAGDLAIDELMIESVAGTGDDGEWIEVESTLPCAINLRGFHAECPDGSKVKTLDVTEDVWIPAGGTFLIADSSNPAINHDLPGTILVWYGEPGDVLRSEGATINLMWNGALIDSVTYPAEKPVVGASVAFPSDCPASERSVWSFWQTSSSSWFPGFFGTPNAPNTDIHCL